MELALNGVLLDVSAPLDFGGSWTLFSDMHSGGFSKEPWDEIFIQAPKDVAIAVFKRIFGHSPGEVACSCCGSNYSVSIEENLDSDCISRSALVIKASDILEEWKA